MRTETRAARYASKSSIAQKLPFSLCTTNFSLGANVAYVARALACFGGSTLHIIGNMPSQADLKTYSGGTNLLIDIKQWGNPIDFVRSIGQVCKVVALEIAADAHNMAGYKWDYSTHTIICVGNEMDGLPIEIVKRADDVVYIPMPGPGFCLNTSQAANVAAYSYSTGWSA